MLCLASPLDNLGRLSRGFATPQAEDLSGRLRGLLLFGIPFDRDGSLQGDGQSYCW